MTDFVGIQGSPPLLGDYRKLAKIKDDARYFQILLPLADSATMFIFALLFTFIFFTLNRRNPLYIKFALSLTTWAVFYFFLSGVPRELNFYLGSILHFPARVFASFGVYLLVTRVNSKHPNFFKISVITVTFIALEIIFGIIGSPSLQKILSLFCGLIAFLPILNFRPKSADLMAKVIFTASILALCGQISDSFKLLEPILGFKYELPYLNRMTFVPLLLLSFGDCIIQFSGSFHQLRTHLFKAKSYARIILHSAKEGLTHDNVNYFLKVTSKICGFNRVSLAQRQENGSYKVIKLYGSNFSAEGSIVNLEKNSEIKSAVIDGQIAFGIKANGIADGWLTTKFVAVPVPEDKCPPYLMLLSDPKTTNLNSKDILPYLSQISSAIWTNLERTREHTLRIQTEQKFGSLVQKLDPSLYEFITNNMSKISDPEQLISSTRGIVFFDQKAYSTMTEDFDDVTMGKFARIVGEWVTNSAARYGSRISSFAGDAFLLETFSIGSEPEAAIAYRTLNLVWSLAETMGALNQILLGEGFTPITFRFGAHIGNVAAANLDFIQKGLSNSIGDTVNVAARLQSLAKPGSIYISGELQNYVVDKFVTAPVPKQYVKGRMRKIDIFSLVGKIESTLPDAKRIA